jgi:hypothetical protein
VADSGLASLLALLGVQVAALYAEKLEEPTREAGRRSNTGGGALVLLMLGVPTVLLMGDVS